ncbi:YT521-B-like domain-containing protein [Microdochium trichocladiopsis]|uniref:YT521-B-like domain-containing protein n=1 Tax=Microdochium trichocladiopsis TaxID=1682393 RepID=A0A9P8YBI7_9PEZI|nr:YT521-B-like domain-containing protein [Microdochium trichocladiopsis]KAH7034915.1 YT521-B-like domain-containing protein [Microdochium trichocladiopsis]
MVDQTEPLAPPKESEAPEVKSPAYQGPVSSHDQVRKAPTQTGFDTRVQLPDSEHGQATVSLLDGSQEQFTPTHPSFSMESMANSLPTQTYHPMFSTNGHQQGFQQQHRGGPQTQRFPHIPHSSTMYNHAGAHAPHFSTQPNILGQPFYMQPQAQMPPFYGHHQMAGTQGPPTQLGVGQSRSNPPYYTGPIMMGQHNPSGYYYQPHMGSFSPPNHLHAGNMHGNHYGRMENGDTMSQSTPTPQQNQTVSSSHANVVRGPPRKPRQNGHAIWIGNLPPQTDLMTLVRHVCAETQGLESLFLISKSNCAFANFKDEEKCIAAQQKLHESKFQSVRLVSRLRKSTVEGAAGQTAPTGPASITPTVQVSGSTGVKDQIATPHEIKPTIAQSQAERPSSHTEHEQSMTQTSDRSLQRDRFFVLKSLTVDDLELSVRTGVWATQSHNEEVLNKAFETAANVYLVFSANKSGEYFGYARMTSPINNDPAAAIKFAPKVQSTNDIDLPKSIPTEATDVCPKGRIIDDLSRGTIFWEIDRDEEDEAVSDANSEGSGSIHEFTEGEEESKAWGRPFKLEWQSTTRLPFYRTRGLRNVWNSNRDVKIARDGTELETSVGRKLIGLFNRIHTPAPHGNMAYRAGVMQPAGYGQPTPMPPSYC